MLCRGEEWRRILGTSEVLERAVLLVVRDLPNVLLAEGMMLVEVPRTEEEREYVTGGLRKREENGHIEMVGMREESRIVGIGGW